MKNKETAVIFNIQRFSIYDGPGVRTTVFLKGCNLRCRWCHNPESLSFVPQISLSSDKCIGCGNCFKNCVQGAHIQDERLGHVIDFNTCVSCYKCTKTCYSKALNQIGKTYTVNQLMEEILSDKPYFENSKNGGGVTFSGGECMLQIDFLEEILAKCHENGISTAVDTAGNVPYAYFERINPYTDLYLYDVKAFHKEVHKELTGSSNEQILKNLLCLRADHKELLIRIPVIKGANEQELPAIAEFLRKHGILFVELLPYHSMGNSKWELLLKNIPMESFQEPKKDEMLLYQKQMAEQGIYAKV